MKISVQEKINASIADVWDAWNDPNDILCWNSASDDWQCTKAENDLRVGGKLATRMEARDGSMGFDFGGTYTTVEPHQTLEYTMEDSRVVRTEFVNEGDRVLIRQTFDGDESHSEEQQRQGWQAIQRRFRQHVESKSN